MEFRYLNSEDGPYWYSRNGELTLLSFVSLNSISSYFRFVYLAVVAPLFSNPQSEPQQPKPRPSKQKRLELFDILSPTLLYGGFAVYLFVNPLNNTLGVVACWVLGLPVVMAVYQWLSQSYA